MSTRRLSNRRGFAVLQQLGKLAGTGLVLAGELDHMPEGLTEPQQAMALAEAGDLALTLVVETASGGKSKKLWKAMTPESGAAAALFLAHGLAATTARIASAPNHHLTAKRQIEARALLRRHLPWSAEDEDEIANHTRTIDPLDASGLDQARIEVAFGAIRRVIAAEIAYTLPGFAPLALEDPAERYLSNLSWQNCWNQVLTPWLALTDPEGLRAASG